MAKYKVGDKVRIVRKRPRDNWNLAMDEYLGKTMTIIESGINDEGVYYYMQEEGRIHWYWYEDMISGLAEPEREPYTVELRFDGMITTATLKRGGRDVKTAEARCNPKKDTYSRAEGARVAVERLFEKKRKEDKPKESKPKVGDKFRVIGNQLSGKFRHWFRLGEIVTLSEIRNGDSRYIDSSGMRQWVADMDVRPYRENSK